MTADVQVRALIRGAAILFMLMVVTGPSILLFVDLFHNGLTNSGVEFFLLYALVYCLWCAFLLWRSQSNRPFRWWHMVAVLVATCALPYAAIPLFQVVERVLPPLGSAPSFKEDTIWAWIMITFYPWLIIQFIVFIGFGMRVFSPLTETPKVEL